MFEKEVTLPSADEKYFYKVRTMSGVRRKDHRALARVAGVTSRLDPSVKS